MSRKAKKRTYVRQGKGAKVPRPYTYRTPEPTNPSLETTAARPPFKMRLEEIRNRLTELLNAQHGFLDYIEPMPGTSKSNESCGNSFAALMNDLESLVDHNQQSFQILSTKF